MNPYVKRELAAGAVTMPVGEVDLSRTDLFPSSLPLRGRRIIDVYAGFYDTVLITGNLLLLVSHRLTADLLGLADAGDAIMFGGELDSKEVFGARPARHIFPGQRIRQVAFGLGHALALAEPNSDAKPLAC